MKTPRQMWQDWNPIRLRRLLKNAQNTIEVNIHGWANCHQENLRLKSEISQLEAISEYYEKLWRNTESRG